LEGGNRKDLPVLKGLKLLWIIAKFS
jgi:hypothetical protein